VIFAEKVEKVDGEVNEIEVDRRSLEFGRFVIENQVVNIRGLKDGDVFLALNKYWKIRQKQEKVLCFKIDDPITAFKLGYAIGNLHIRAMLEGNKLCIPIETQNLEEELRDFNPEVDEIKFSPNLEIPIRVKMLEFHDH
jgi:urease accessory protein